MVNTTKTLNAISKIICDSTKEVLDLSTGREITFAKTIQKVPVVHLRPDIGCFVLFNGDYGGLIIMNFTAEAAMSIYRNQMLKMGLPEEELAIEYTADEVVDSIGELINQIIGNVRREIEEQYDLVATNTQPKAIALTTSIVLTIDAPEYEKDLCRKISFKIDGLPFHLELSMEKTEFIRVDGGKIHNSKKRKTKVDNMDIGEYKKSTPPAKGNKTATNEELDFDALMRANKL